jgi:hypothetical protein
MAKIRVNPRGGAWRNDGIVSTASLIVGVTGLATIFA